MIFLLIQNLIQLLIQPKESILSLWIWLNQGTLTLLVRTISLRGAILMYNWGKKNIVWLFNLCTEKTQFSLKQSLIWPKTKGQTFKKSSKCCNKSIEQQNIRVHQNNRDLMCRIYSQLLTKNKSFKKKKNHKNKRNLMNFQRITLFLWFLMKI